MQKNRSTSNPVRGRQRLIWCGLLLLSLFAFPAAADEGPNGEELEALEAKSAKTLGCNTTNHYCTGPFNEVILWIKTYASGVVQLQLHGDIPDLITPSLGCSFVGDRVYVSPKADSDGGEENILNQLYISAALDTNVRLKFVAGTDGKCALDHIFAYFLPSPP